MSVMVKALGYYSHRHGSRSVSRLKAHLKYLEHGKAHLNRPEGFDHGQERVSRREFLSHINEQPQSGVIAHKLVISLSQDERDRRGIDMRELVRETMSDFERHTGRTLRWVAFEHDDTGHPHVHVVVGGYDRNGKQVGIYPRDLKQLTRLADRQVDRLGEWSRVTGLDLTERAEAQLRPVPSPERLPNLLEKVRNTIREMLARTRGMDRER